MKINQIAGLALIGVAIICVFLAPEIAAVVLCLIGVLMVCRVVNIGIVEDFPTEPTLYRYEVHHRGSVQTVYAASINTDEVDARTVHFMDHDGNIIAIYTQVTSVVSRKVLSEED